MNTESREYKAAQQIESIVNDYGFDAAKCAEACCLMHKTNQQSTMRLVIQIIKALAENKNIDLRNRAAHEAAKRLMEVVVCLDPLPMV